MNKNNYSLREKKYAKTKVALANAFIKQLKNTRFSDISIKEICEKVEVSEGTFYNYFPHKIDIACYFNKFTILKLIWEIKNTKEKQNYVDMIEHAFDVLADVIKLKNGSYIKGYIIEKTDHSCLVQTSLGTIDNARIECFDPSIEVRDRHGDVGLRDAEVSPRSKFLSGLNEILKV